MGELDRSGRTDPSRATDELTALSEFLDYQRGTIMWKTAGLDRDALARTTASTTMTLGGLLKHLWLVEDHWFIGQFSGDQMPEPWASVDWEEDHDWDWNSAAADDPDALRDGYLAACERSRAIVAAASSLDQMSATEDREGKPWSLRWIMIHMIEETARHAGHADLLREAIDGEVGE